MARAVSEKSKGAYLLERVGDDVVLDCERRRRRRAVRKGLEGRLKQNESDRQESRAEGGGLGNGRDHSGVSDTRRREVKQRVPGL